MVRGGAQLIARARTIGETVDPEDDDRLKLLT
jgi:hypothetical protein